MKRLTIILLTLIALAAPAAAEVPTHDITIIAGQPWQMMVQFRLVTGIPVERHGNYYLAYISTGALLSDGLLARMYVEASTVNPTALLLSLTADQTTALAGIPAAWSLVYIPDLGVARIVSQGKVHTK